MTPEERQMLSGLFDRIRAAANGPRDAEADAFINDAARATPGAAYVLAQTVLVQQQALEAAARHIADMEAQAKAQPPAPQEGGFLGNLGRNLFGGPPPVPAPAQRPYDPRAYERDPGPAYAPQRPAYAPPPPPPQASPWSAPPPAPPQAGPWAAAPQPGGFLHGALQTGAGVAGGMLLGNALGGLFGGHGGGGGLFGGGLGGGGLGAPNETIHETVNNYYGGEPGGQAMGDDRQGMNQDAAFDPGGGDDNFADGDDSSGGGDDYA